MNPCRVLIACTLRVGSGVLAAGALSVCIAATAAPGPLRTEADPASGRQQVTVDVEHAAAGEAGGLSVRLGSAGEYRDRGIDYPAVLNEAALQIVPTTRGGRAVRVSWRQAQGSGTFRLVLVLRTESTVDVRAYTVAVGPAAGEQGGTAVGAIDASPPTVQPIAAVAAAPAPLQPRPPPAQAQAVQPPAPGRAPDPGRPAGDDPGVRPGEGTSAAGVARARQAAARDREVGTAFEEMDARLRKLEASITNVVAASEAQGQDVERLQTQVAQWQHTRRAQTQGGVVPGSVVPERVALGGAGPIAATRAPLATSPGGEPDWRLQSAVGLGLAIAAAGAILALRRWTAPPARR